MNPIYVPRKIESVLEKLVKQFPAVVLTGPRQSGKSTVLNKKFPRHQYFSFDDPVLRDQAINDPNLFLDNAGRNIIIDEIQYVPELLSYLKIRIDRDRSQKGRFLLTGSQQFSLMKNLGDSLAGRIGLLELLPFGMPEKKNIPGLGLTTPTDYFVHACLKGDFPEIAVHKEMDSHIWYAGYLQTYLERDIRSVYNVGSLRDFQQFLKLLAARCSQVLNLSNISGDIGVSVNTIKRWVSILEASRIIYLLPPYYGNLGKRITKTPKVYFVDCGLVCYLTGLKNRDHLLNGPMAGALFENFCVQETIKTFLNRAERPPLYYLRTHNNLEVDLLIETGLRTVIPIEIKLTKTPKPAMAENIDALRKIFPKVNFKKGKILSLSESEQPLTAHVTAQPLDDYLAEI
jgi:predicted AAA+ superfamily ATPase